MSSGGIPLTATSVVRAGEAYSVESLNRLATQHRELEAIVRDLAANEPLAEMNSDYPQYRYCLYCEANNAPGPGQPETSDPPGVVHADGCNWRKAVEWVERHG